MRIFEIEDTDELNAEESYASSQQLKSMAARFNDGLPNANFKVQGKILGKPIPHIRAQKLSDDELLQAATKLNLTQVPPDMKQQTLSRSYPVFSFKDVNDVLYSVVIGRVGKETSGSVGISRKELTPTNLGLAGKEMTKSELIELTKKSVIQHVRDERLQNALIQLVDIAANRGIGKLSLDSVEVIAPIIGTINQDFGEILSPLIVMNDKDIAEFPVGNNPIVDVKIGKINMSVKALSGSGTSFPTIKDLMDSYEESIEQNEEKERYQILKQFHPHTGGKNVDKIIRAAAQSGIPEYKQICHILGTDNIFSFSELEQALARVGQMSYANFLKTFYPAMIAGGWGRPVGMPSDGLYYLGNTNKPPSKTRVAGKSSYDRNPITSGANILTYVLGTGLLDRIKKGDDAKKYQEMMTNIVNKANAILGHLTINRDGSMNLITKPFSELNFQFQYHAPSHIPGNNLPGFIAIH